MSKPQILRIPIDELDEVFNKVGFRWEMLRGKRVFLSGGTGFIGKWLIATFLYANRHLGLRSELAILSRKPTVFLEEYPELIDATEITWLTGDVRNFELSDVSNFSYAIHAATDVTAAAAPLEILDTCVAGTRRVIDGLLSSSIPCRMLLLSSGAIYGRAPAGIDAIPENFLSAPDSLSAASAYGEGKRVSELLCALSAAENSDFNVSIARCFAFVGPHLPFDKHFAIGNFIGAALRGEDICVQGDGSPLRSYLYAADLAHWLWVLLFGSESCRAYNVGGLEPISIGDLAHRVNRVLGGRGAVRIAKARDFKNAPQVYVPSIQRISAELGLVPQVSLDDAILRTANWATKTHNFKI